VWGVSIDPEDSLRADVLPLERPAAIATPSLLEGFVGASPGSRQRESKADAEEAEGGSGEEEDGGHGEPGSRSGVMGIICVPPG
jgi:hypothetical protein